MPSVFDNAISSALTLRRSFAGQTVAYSDGTNSGNVTAVRGKPNVKTADALVVTITERYVDWLIPAAELEAIDPAVSLPPQPGHTITANGDTFTVAYFEGLPAWSWVDSGETEYRIHTIKTGDT